jgi:AraC-like DNA-binding protein
VVELVLQGQTEHGFIGPRALWHYNLMYDPAVMLAGAEGLRALPGYQALFLLEPQYRRGRRFRSHLRLSPESLKPVRGMLQELENEMKTKAPGWRHLVQASFLRLVVFLARAYPPAAESATPPEAAGLYRLAETLAFMETHFREPLTVDGLAARAALSRRHFLRVFKHYQGTSPVEYLICLRLEHAARLLARPGMRVGEAAHAAGFRDSNYFARQFRRVYGHPPRQH